MGDQANSRALRSNTTLQDAPSSAHKTFLEIRTAILSSPKDSYLVYEDIPPNIGLIVLHALAEDLENLLPRMTYNSHTRTIQAIVMPTRIHDIPQYWLTQEMYEMIRSNFLSAAESRYVTSGTGTTIEHFGPPYVGSSKEPDWLLTTNGDRLPSIVAESGWTESRPKLIADMELWLRGGQPSVQLVLIVNWTKRTNNSVAGEVRVYERNAAGMPNERFRSSIFPIPQGGPTSIPITRGEMFGVSGVLPGQNAADVWQLSLASLRRIADVWIRDKGYVPA